jgi:hypothetical protein
VQHITLGSKAPDQVVQGGGNRLSTKMHIMFVDFKDFMCMLPVRKTNCIKTQDKA